MLDVYSIDSVLVIHPHPDDELFSSSLISGLVERGRRIRAVALTGGEGRRKGTAAKRMALVRYREFGRSCSFLGVSDYAVWEFPDGGLEGYPRHILIGKIAEEILAFRPGLIITFGLDGWTHHRDHITASQSVVEAANGRCPVLGATLPEPFSERALSILRSRRKTFGSYDDNARHPALEGLVTIKTDWQAKVSVVAAHRSQKLCGYLSILKEIDEYFQWLG